MNTQMERQGHQQHPQAAELRSAGRHPPSIPTTGVEVEGGVHDHELGEEHEKKSVLKKVKAKAKKIKDTITKHGHGHAHHDHADDDDMEQGTEVHGAHNNLYESKEVQSHLPAQVGGGCQTKTSAAVPSAMGHSRTDANPEAKIESREVLSPLSGQPAASIQHDVVLGGGPGITTATAAPFAVGNHQSDANPITSRQGHELSDYRSFVPEQVGVSKHNGVTFGGSQTYPVGVGAHKATNLPIISCLKKKREIFDTPTSQESDPHGPRGDVQPQNYQSMVEDPTRKGGQEVGATPILHSLNKMAIFDDKSENPNAKTSMAQLENVERAVEDHHSLSSGIGSHDQFVSELLSCDTRTFAMNREQDNTGFASGSLTEQDIGITGLSVSSATSLIADKAIRAKNAVASKLGYGGEGEHPDTTVPSGEGEDQAGKASSVTDYGKKVVSTVYDKGVSTKDYIAEKVSPREEDKALSDVIVEKMSRREDDKELSKKAEPSGKVTFSAKVARQLGTDKERSEDESSGKTGPRGVVAETLKNTVTSWLGIGGDTGPSYVTYHDLPKEANEGEGANGEPSLK